MREFTADPTSITKASVAVLHNAKDQDPVNHYGAFIGLDVHKESIVVAIARPGREPGEYHKEIANKPKSVEKLVRSSVSALPVRLALRKASFLGP